MSAGESGGPIRAFIAPDSPCAVCGNPLTPHQVVTGGVCDDTECRREVAVRHASEAKRRKRRGQLARARAWFSRLRQADPERYPGDALVAVLPLNMRPLAPFPEARRRAIRDHLTAALSEAAARLPDLEAGEWVSPAPPFTYDVRESELPVLGAACATCRGQCCAVGGDHAFLSSDVFIPRLLADPDLTTDDLLEEYLGYLPEIHFQDQCVYQSDTGCRLPREGRSATCNTFLCNSLLKLGEDTMAHGPRAVFGVTMEGDTIRGGALLRDGRLEFRVGPHPDQATFR
ncbi:MAG: hypothetical protein ABFS86_12405 [Planctomycetota bacterium]